MVPARRRWHDRNYDRPGRAAAGAVSLPECAPVDGRQGRWDGRRPLAFRQITTSGQLLGKVSPHGDKARARARPLPRALAPRPAGQRACGAHDRWHGAGGRGQRGRCVWVAFAHGIGPGRVSSCLVMGVFDQRAGRVRPHEPIPPVWRMFCRCSFRAGRRGEIAACGCRSWWRVGRGGRWYAISKRRALRALLPQLMRELGHFEATGSWPGS